MAAAPLHLFPFQSPTRKSSKKILKLAPEDEVSSELEGVAFQVDTAPVVQPTNESVKHSSSHPAALRNFANGPRPAPRPHFHFRRRSTVSSLSETSTCTVVAGPTEDDHLTALSLNTRFGFSTTPVRHPARQLRQGAVPGFIKTGVPTRFDSDDIASPGGDRLSPLPTKDRFTPTSPRSSGFPATASVHSGSPTLIRSNSGATSLPSYKPAESAPVRSIFPEYDHSKPLFQQEYYPANPSRVPTLPNEKVSKGGPAVERRSKSDVFESHGAQVNGYEHIPIADKNDHMGVCDGSYGQPHVSRRKVKFGLYQPRATGLSLAIGVSADRPMYSMEKRAVNSPRRMCPRDELVVKRFSAVVDTGSSVVAQLALPPAAIFNQQHDANVLSIFPQGAADDARKGISTMITTSKTAKHDSATPEAARFAQDAISDTREKHQCDLVRAIRRRDSLGAVTATYVLKHPALGTFTLTVNKSTSPTRHAKDPRAKISLHHPSATSAAVTAETLVLAYIDFSHDACVIDVPGLLTFGDPYLIDVVVCTLLAVAVIENDTLKAESMHFDAPPTSPFPSSKRKSRAGPSRASKSSTWLGKSPKKVESFAGEQVDLPIISQGALAVIGLSFKTAVWLLEAGVKAATGTVIGATRLARKL